MTKVSKNIERAYELLTDTSLLHESEQCSVHSVCRGLANSVAPNAAGMDNTQIESWARAISDLTLDRTGAEMAIKLGALQSIINFLRRYKSSEDLNRIADVSWSDVLIATHNFALLEDKGFPEALELISPADLRSLADNLSHALKPGEKDSLHARRGDDS